MTGTAWADDALSRTAEALATAFAQRSTDDLAPLLHADVRWGGPEDTAETCHGRADVLAFYARLLADGVGLEIRNAAPEGDRIRLLVRVTSPSDDGVDAYEVPALVTVRAGLIADVLQLDA